MRIVVDARLIGDAYPGIGRATVGMLTGLATERGPHDVVALIDPQRRDTRFGGIERRISGVRWVSSRVPATGLAGALALAYVARRAGADMLHSPTLLAPIIASPCPIITTHYDVIPRVFPDSITRGRRLPLELATRLRLHQAQRVQAVSNSAAAGARVLYGVDPARIDIVPLGIDARFRPPSAAALADLRTRLRLPDRYVLTIGTPRGHKRLAALAAAWPATATLALVRAGFGGALRSDGTGVRDLGAIADVDLPALYGGASAFVCASRYEGFGLPPLEAMACGAPVVYADHSSLTEVLGDAAWRCPADDVAALAEAARQIADDAALAASWRARGLAHAAGFTWLRSARALLASYARALGGIH